MLSPWDFKGVNTKRYNESAADIWRKIQNKAEHEMDTNNEYRNQVWVRVLSRQNLARVIQTGLYHECKIWQREHE